ncbi:unnamed protein product [Rotaria sp. Silwood1]|nr:unnamed protein product [Rotaria sp. Silwood1]
MTHSVTMYALCILIFLSILSTIESSQCLKKCTFPSIPLNSSLPSDFCSISKSNDDMKQQCRVKLTIDFTTGLVDGSFNPENRSILTDDELTIETTFSLNNTSVQVNIRYDCSVSDYCDLDFVREALSSDWSAIQVQPIREKLVSRLYNPNNTLPIKCFNDNSSCLPNESLCSIAYLYLQSSNSTIFIGRCQNITKSPKVEWIQLYQPRGIGKGLTEGIVYDCNTPTCGYNTSIIETVKMLSHEYILPLNLSVINTTTTTPRPTTTSSSTVTSKSTWTTTTSNHAPYLFVNFFNTLMISFLITKYF